MRHYNLGFFENPWFQKKDKKIYRINIDKETVKLSAQKNLKQIISQKRILAYPRKQKKHYFFNFIKDCLYKKILIKVDSLVVKSIAYVFLEKN